MDGTSTEDLTPVIRTDFSDDQAWSKVVEAIKQPDSDIAEGLGLMNQMYAAIGQESLGDGEAMLNFVDDKINAGLALIEVLDSKWAKNDFAILIVADQLTMTDPEQPVLVADLMGEWGRNFRSLPSQINLMESNLSLANVDWEDYADHIDDRGIFRGH